MCFALNFSGFVIIFIHYHHVRESNITGLPLIQGLNYWSLWIGGLSCLGMSIVANFQVLVIPSKLTTVEALVSGHPRDGIKMSLTGAGRLREWFS